VVAVRPRILRVLVENLLTNAIRYAGDGARCTISARTEGRVAVLLSVSDNGPGVPDDELRDCSNDSSAATARERRAAQALGWRS
jgi:signal transduction histidine kinase